MQLIQTESKRTYQETLDTALTVVPMNSSSEAWTAVNQAIRSAAKIACNQGPVRQRSHWISGKSMDLLDKRRLLPVGRKHRTARKRVCCELKQSLRADREAWWNSKAEEMEVAHASGNVSKLFKIMRSTGAKRVSIDENILSKTVSVYQADQTN